MKYTYSLLTDASADMDPDFAAGENISIIPMNYLAGDVEHTADRCLTEQEFKEFYQSEREGKMTRTSQVSPQTYLDCFRSYAEKGESVLYLSLSGGLSGTYNTALFTAKEIMEEFPGVTIRCVDTLSATAGVGLLMEKAAENRKAGMSIEENAVWLENNRLKVCHWFMVDDLKYLKRNGRISAATATMGSVLGIKPVLRIENSGSLINFAKRRGTKAALNQLVCYYNEASDKEAGERVFIVHADNADGAEYLEGEIRKINPDAIITTSYLCPVIGCHTGPGMCAVIHFGKRIL